MRRKKGKPNDLLNLMTEHCERCMCQGKQKYSLHPLSTSTNQSDKSGAPTMSKRNAVDLKYSWRISLRKNGSQMYFRDINNYTASLRGSNITVATDKL